jgi:dissimilatory sulfite reductase (desulfoviridin) alpha/beta subunit
MKSIIIDDWTPPQQINMTEARVCLACQVLTDRTACPSCGRGTRQAPWRTYPQVEAVLTKFMGGKRGEQQ